jgi:hypothetical protein
LMATTFRIGGEPCLHLGKTTTAFGLHE